MSFQRVVAFDLETTGLDTETCKIVEFCFIELDDRLEEVSRWTQRVDPGIPIPPETTAIHGITDADVAGKPRFEAFAEKIQGLVDDAILMAYNHEYDTTVLHYELARAGQKGLPVTPPVVDPLTIFREHHPHSLAGAVKQYLEQDFEDAHAAEADTEMMVDVFRAQVARHGLPPTASGNLLRRDRTYLDRGRRFYEDEGGTPRFGFGKYRDEPVADHLDYVQWILNKDFPEDTKNVAKQLVDRFIERPPPRQTSL